MRVHLPYVFALALGLLDAQPACAMSPTATLEAFFGRANTVLQSVDPERGLEEPRQAIRDPVEASPGCPAVPGARRAKAGRAIHLVRQRRVDRARLTGGAARAGAAPGASSHRVPQRDNVLGPHPRLREGGGIGSPETGGTGEAESAREAFVLGPGGRLPDGGGRASAGEAVSPRRRDRLEELAHERRGKARGRVG